jgi:spore protease
MSREIDLNKYRLRTDLVVETIDDNNIEYDGIIIDKQKEKNIQITTIDVLIDGVKKIGKKPGKYITIEFDDVTDNDNKNKVLKVFKKQLKKLFDHLKITEDDSCLIIGLGNDKSTPDSLGPYTVNDIIVTRHIKEIAGSLEKGYREVSAFNPGVMGTTGIETSKVLEGLIAAVKPNFLIVIDALAASSINRLNKTIQMTDTGIHPGSGVGNTRKEISKEILGIPVIAIGIPTVVDAVTIVSDTINYIYKLFSYNKTNINNPITKMVPTHLVNYIKENKKDTKLNEKEKTNLMGLIGNLSEIEIRNLISEVLSPIGYNLMVTPKEIDFVMLKLAEILSEGINGTIHRQVS